MRWRIRPRDDSFYDFFVRAGTNLVEGAAVLAGLKSADADRAAVSARMAELEHANDEVTHGLYRKLNKSFVTPFDRGDVHRLGASLDDVMDHMESVGTLVHLYGLSGLPALPTGMHEMIDIIGQCAAQLAEAMPRLPELDRLEGYCIELNRLENHGDQTYRALLVELFGGDYDPLCVLKLKEIADQLELTVDSCEQVAHVLETIVLKES
ncbi:DUF47 domain-containing protein [Actinokineospora enzanensis]|uniref:DUF47 domain-containing protein n=1 Tax=Actinokineospora enzanensis TaxID=155975 RepID=UPI0003709976|nr:DUF47 family protein [Actinokineospora enzanensis]